MRSKSWRRIGTAGVVAATVAVMGAVIVVPRTQADVAQKAGPQGGTAAIILPNPVGFPGGISDLNSTFFNGLGLNPIIFGITGSSTGTTPPQLTTLNNFLTHIGSTIWQTVTVQTNFTSFIKALQPTQVTDALANMDTFVHDWGTSATGTALSVFASHIAALSATHPLNQTLAPKLSTTQLQAHTSDVLNLVSSGVNLANVNTLFTGLTKDTALFNANLDNVLKNTGTFKAGAFNLQGKNLGTGLSLTTTPETGDIRTATSSANLPLVLHGATFLGGVSIPAMSSLTKGDIVVQGTLDGTSLNTNATTASARTAAQAPETVTVDVPVANLTGEGNTVGIASADAKTLQALATPQGVKSWIAGVDVALSSTCTDANHPIGLSVANDLAAAGDKIYKVDQAGHLTQVGAVGKDGSWSVSFCHDPGFVLAQAAEASPAPSPTPTPTMPPTASGGGTTHNSTISAPPNTGGGPVETPSGGIEVGLAALALLGGGVAAHRRRRSIG